MWLSACCLCCGQMGTVRECSVAGVLWWLWGCGFGVLMQCSIDWEGCQEPLAAEWEHAWEMWREGVHLPFIDPCPLRQPLYPFHSIATNDGQRAKASIKLLKMGGRC